MARILVSFFSPVTDNGLVQPMVYYESLMGALAENGNDVFFIISTDFISTPWNGSNAVKPQVDCEKLKAYIKSLNIELAIIFNNSVPRDAVEALDCPVTLWHGDSFEYFNDKAEILKAPDRYHFVCPFADTEEYLLKNYSIKPNQILRIMPATNVRAEKTISQIHNISFIGTPFIAGYQFINYLKTHGPSADLIRLADVLKNGGGINLDEKDRLLLEELYKSLPQGEFIALNSSQKRTLTLGLVSELGLDLYGGEGWLEIGLYLPWLAMSYRKDKIYSLKHNQDIYNSSRLSLNISHAQATDGFPWRVMDIMASNSLLVTDWNKGIESFTAGEVEIPSYKNPREAYDLCQKLLNNESLRLELVAKSQSLIEKNGRWHHRFPILEERLGIKLFQASHIENKVSQIVRVQVELFEKKNTESQIQGDILRQTSSEIPQLNKSLYQRARRFASRVKGKLLR